MTDHARMCAMLSSAGIAEIPYDWDSHAWHGDDEPMRHYSCYQRTDTPNENWQKRNGSATQAIKIVDGGYTGFFVVMVFDRDGALLGIEAWE